MREKHNEKKIEELSFKVVRCGVILFGLERAEHY